MPGNVKANHQSSIAQKYEAASKLCFLFPTGNSQMFGETSRYPKQTNIRLGTMDSLMSPSYVLQVARPVLNRSSQQLNFLQTTNLNKRDRVHPDRGRTNPHSILIVSSSSYVSSCLEYHKGNEAEEIYRR
jgi:hypothetical protein